APVDEEVAQEHDLDGLKPPRLRRDRRAERLRDDPAEPVLEVRQRPEDESAPEQVLPQEEAEVGQPARPEEALPRLRGEGQLERAEHQHEEAEADPGVEEERVQAHGGGPARGVTVRASTPAKATRSARPAPPSRGAR